jgi:CRISPR/Cas system-associated endonuclease Cas1
MALYGAETWTLRAADQKYLESFEMWCWRRMEISWTDHVRNEEVLFRVNEQRNILHEIKKRKANWICHILRRNCLLKQVIEGKIKREMEVTRQGRRRKKLLDDRKEQGRILSFEGRSTRSHYVEGSFWRRLWTCHQDRILNE